ncbi:MAG: hypothetical protein JWQ55_9 [Rhodopila sp.]|jgi:hypothetical protein|nr:hypothetical protein [Rhodopila sp.]
MPEPIRPGKSAGQRGTSGGKTITIGDTAVTIPNRRLPCLTVSCLLGQYRAYLAGVQ